MSGRFVRASKYRHVYGQPTKKEQCYENVRVSNNAWDSNLIKVNPLYLSVNWNASGGGAFAVIPLSERGKIPDQIPLFRGHTAAVLDTDWNPFDDHVIASGSEDSKVGIWKVPENYSVLREQGDSITDVQPAAKLSGHTRKVGHVQFHPVANNVLASSSGDYTVKFWDIEAGKAKTTLKHNDMVVSMSFNYIGSLIATTSRDKKIRIWDPRSEKVVVEGPGHAGAKNQRVVWMGEHDRIATTGFSRMSDRQVGIWDTTDIKKGPIGDFYMLDSSAGICMPFYDAGTKCLYLAGKGDGNIRYFEYDNDELFPLSEYKSAEPQRGLAFMPKRGISVHDNEVVRAYKTVHDSLIEPIQFIVPRRAENFQADIYPDCPSGEPAISAAEWFDGKDAAPKLINLESVYDGVEPIVVDGTIPRSAPVQEVAQPVPPAAIEPVKQESKPTPAPAATYTAPEKDLDKILSTPKVDDMLTKASEADDAPVPAALAKEESSWEAEDADKPVVETVKPELKEAIPEAAPESAPESTQPAATISADEPVTEPAAEPAPKPTGAGALVARKLETLHNHFTDVKETLDSYEQRFAEMIAFNAKELDARDTRIGFLEQEIEKLKGLLIGKNAETVEETTVEVNGKKEDGLEANDEAVAEAADETAEPAADN
ncbi:hypothetical protein V1525DRAFT_354468 [Lipomyces kononenkoae]|uniref:Uncharacterized protein n=1 Tax=Lipomyces kononenkoae TaxID=34357 RepID=A0ACC3TB95_LIPKO